MSSGSLQKVLKEKDENSAFQTAALMQQARIVNLDAALALSAAKISIEAGLPLADSIILATAYQYNAVIWTQDEHFQGIKSVRYIPKKPVL